jgi:dipeptidyl aminopeptidase/acylaminoacyl peptidase
MAAYGSWPTPITSELVVRAAAGLSGVALDGDSLVWSEQRPEEGGRTQLVRRTGGGAPVDLLPDGLNARTAAHEYGGGAWWVRDGTVWFAHWADQRLYRLTGDGAGDSEPEPVTPQPEVPRGDRWADGDLDPTGRWLAVVREHHPPGGGGSADVVNEIVVLDTTGVLPPRALVSGADFVSDPRFSPDGRRLCWLQWSHPDMPWDGTELCVADLRTGEVGPALAHPQVVAGRPHLGPGGHGDGESVSEPRWADDGALWFISDRTGWWNLYAWSDGEVVPRVQSEAEIGMPQWVFGQSRYAFAAGGRVVFAYQSGGLDHLAVLHPDGTTTDLDLPYTVVRSLKADGDRVVLIAASATHGGPTAAAQPLLQLGIQYWTSRGFGVVDVNYGGSTGYGRDYREQLRGAWGVVDLDDCEAAARHLAAEGRVDPARLCIRGGSAGGYTTLAVLAFRDTFAAGASHFGVADLEALATETHKFESRYLDGLIGPYPERRDLYVERSPIHHTGGFDRPLIVLQGLEDEVVPPNQAQMIVDALRSRHVPVAYVTFEGEQHGFRQSANIRRALDSELSFYAQVFGFETPPEEKIEPVEVENL